MTGLPWSKLRSWPHAVTRGSNDIRQSIPRIRALNQAFGTGLGVHKGTTNGRRDSWIDLRGGGK